jgi:hypothetical protein
MSRRASAALEIREWAQDNGVEIVALKACGRPADAVADQFPPRAPGGPAFGLMPAWYWRPFRYFEITTIDDDHVRRSGIARVGSEVHNTEVDLERTVDFVWFRSEQLSWRDRPRRGSAQLPDARAEGWCTDHTGAHELRWYSVGTPTDLVKNGAIEGRDPPAPPAVR